MHEMKLDEALRETKTCVQQDLSNNDVVSKEA